MARLYPGFSPKEYELLQRSLEQLGSSKPKDMERAMKTLLWFKESTCPCNYHVVKRGKQWQLRPTTTVPSDLIQQLPTVSHPKILLRRKLAKLGVSKTTEASKPDVSEFTDSPTTPDGTNHQWNKLL